MSEFDSKQTESVLQSASESHDSLLLQWARQHTEICKKFLELSDSRRSSQVLLRAFLNSLEQGRSLLGQGAELSDGGAIPPVSESRRLGALPCPSTARHDVVLPLSGSRRFGEPGSAHRDEQSSVVLRPSGARAGSPMRPNVFAPSRNYSKKKSF